MELLLDPKLVDAVNRATVKRDWRAIARRIEAQEGRWQLIEIHPGSDKDAARDHRLYCEEKLRGVGCRVQVVGLQGMNIHQRPWSGWAFFARIPHSIVAPSGKVY